MSVRVRLAKITDLSDVVALAKAAHEESNYQPIPFNAVMARRTAKTAMTDRNSRVWVTVDRHNRVVGFLIGIAGAMHWSSHGGASDLYFTANAGGDLLLDAFIAWAKLRGVARIDMAISGGISPERERAARRLFEAKGFVYSGPCFHANLISGEHDERHRQAAPQADAALC